MKRKYFSALLMGALTIASVSTFTSCKDYDDDINNLQRQIDDLSKTLSELQTKINDGSILKSVESDGNGGIIVTVTKKRHGHFLQHQTGRARRCWPER